MLTLTMQHCTMKFEKLIFEIENKNLFDQSTIQIFFCYIHWSIMDHEQI
jgi:hypothetical protein